MLWLVSTVQVKVRVTGFDLAGEGRSVLIGQLKESPGVNFSF